MIMSDNQYDEFVGRLHTKFPAMFSGRYGGIACGSGWWPMIEKLCGVIQSHIDHSKGKCPQVVVDQVKEKFGGLRFYINEGSDEIFKKINSSENKSYEICETCGEKGNMRTDIGWYRTLCNKHYEEYI
jgi:hypothetical protein